MSRCDGDGCKHCELEQLQRYKMWVREFAPDVYEMLTGSDRPVSRVRHPLVNRR